jgi:hypothetical protein
MNMDKKPPHLWNGSGQSECGITFVSAENVPQGFMTHDIDLTECMECLKGRALKWELRASRVGEENERLMEILSNIKKKIEGR